MVSTGVPCGSGADRGDEEEVHRGAPAVRKNLPGSTYRCSVYLCETRSSFLLQNKAKVTDEVLRAFMDPARKIEPHFGKAKTAA
jgi:hypothetical protein